MATIRVDITSEDRASRNIQDLRRRVTDLNEQIARNNARVAAGTAEQRRATAEVNRGLRSEAALLRIQQQRQSQALAALRRETGLLENVNQQTRLLTRLTRGLGGVVAAVGFGVLASEVSEFIRGTTEASVRVEGFRNSLTALYGSAQIANTVLADLQDLARLPGITFQGAVEGAVRLKTVGVEGDRALAVIREFGNAAALSGATTQEMTRAIVGFTQNLSRGQIEQDNLNQILENVPLIGNAIRESFNSIDAETIRNQLDAAGQGVQDFADILVNQLSMGARASADTAANAFSNLGNSVFGLQTAIGDRLTPVLADAARGLGGFIDGITDAITANETFAEVLARVNAELTAATGRAELQTAVDNGREAIEAFIAQAELAIRNNSVFFGGREDAILTAQINQAREALEEYNGIAEQSTETEAELRAELLRQNDALADVQQRQTERNDLIAEQGASARRASRIYLENLTEEEIAIVGQIEQLEAQLAAFEAVGMEAEEATDTATEGINETTEAAEMATQAVQSLSDVLSVLQDSVAENQTLLTALAESQIDDFFRLATGEIQAYDAAIQTVIPSVVSLTNAENALTAAIDANLSILNEFAGDAQTLIDTYESLSDGLTSYAADQEIANAEARLVNPAISQAADSLRDYNDVLLEAGINYRDVSDISADLTESLRDTATAFDDIGSSIESTEPSLDIFDTQMQQIASEAMEATEAFEVFRDDTLQFIDDIAFGLDPLIDKLGDTGEEINSFVGAIASAVSGDIPGVIRNVLNIVLPGLTDPQRILEFEQPVAGADPQRLNLQGLGLTPVQLEQLDFSGVAPGLRALLGLEGGGEGGFNVFQARSRQDLARATAEATGTDRQAIEDIAREQYGAGAYDTEFAAATAEVVEQIVEDVAGSAVEALQGVDTSLIQNALQRAQFGLGLATDEGDFERRRQQLILQTTAYYDAELERINGLMLSEAELQDQREDNELARDRALQRATTATNTFTQARLRGEREAQEAAERTAAQEQRDAERRIAQQEREEEQAARAAERQAEREAREAEREAERQRREDERLAQEQQRQEAQAQREAERLAQRQSAAGAGLLQAGVGRAQFTLGLSTDESDFERNRQFLIDATNDYYDNELERIDGLVGAELELHNLRTELARDRALQQAADATNPFEQQRLRDEAEAERDTARAAAEAEREAERAAAAAERQAAAEARAAERAAAAEVRAAERAERERVRAAEQAQRERERLLERQQREQQRAIEMRLRQEMQLQDKINSLRDASVEAEERRADRLLEIYTRSARQREDLERGLSRNVEDFFREQLGDARFRDIQGGQFGGIFDQLLGSITSGIGQGRTGTEAFGAFAEGFGGSFGLANLFGLSPAQLSGLDELITPFARQKEDIGIGVDRAREDALLTSQEALAGIQKEIAATQQATAMLTSETAAMESTNVVSQAENAMMEATNITGQATNNMMFATNIDKFGAAAENFTGEGFGQEVANALTSAFDPILTAFSDLPMNITDSLTSSFEHLTTAQPTVPLAATPVNTEILERATAQPATPTSIETISILANTVNVSGATVNGGGGQGGVQDVRLVNSGALARDDNFVQGVEDTMVRNGRRGQSLVTGGR